VQMGISMVPENRRLFKRMTVSENLELGGYLRKDRDALAEDYERVFGLFPRLRERLSQVAGTLSGGEQQMVAMARALMARPKVLLMDEPSMGLAPVLVAQNFELIEQVNDEGTTVFLVEQNANMALSIADRGYVLQTGQVVLADTAQALRENPDMRRAYLGEM
jgi:branched-chain amino acid transport system ATP-binding protein